jgi:hypothetical protein
MERPNRRLGADLQGRGNHFAMKGKERKIFNTKVTKSLPKSHEDISGLRNMADKFHFSALRAVPTTNVSRIRLEAIE